MSRIDYGRIGPWTHQYSVGEKVGENAFHIDRKPESWEENPNECFGVPCSSVPIKGSHLNDTLPNGEEQEER